MFAQVLQKVYIDTSNVDDDLVSSQCFASSVGFLNIIFDIALRN